MKIRSNFVSNSSSSSFIIAGKNILSTLRKFIHDDKMVNYEPRWYEDEKDFSYGEVAKEIIRQCQISKVEDIKNIIFNKVYESCENYIIQQYYKLFTDKKPNVFDLDDVSEDKFYEKYFQGTDFDIPIELKFEINKEMYEYSKKNPNASSWEYLNFGNYISESQKKIENIVNDIYNDFKSKYKEMYCVSFGDNHGNCEGRMGTFVEYDYLGNKSILNHMNTDWNIYRMNEH